MVTPIGGKKSNSPINKQLYFAGTQPNLPSKLSGIFSNTLVPLTSTASMTDSSVKRIKTTNVSNYYHAETHNAATCK